MNERIQIWFDALCRNYFEHQVKMLRSMGSDMDPAPINFEIVEGKKYLKVVQTIKAVGVSTLKSGRQTVHAFVDKVTGDVYKAATWKQPAKIVRYNLLDDNSFNDMIEKCDWAGSYLYIQ
jgi:hypothetical protein